MILVSGVTGRVGKEVAKCLSSKGIPFRALVRDEQKVRSSQDFASVNIELVEGDMQDSGSLRCAMKGVDRAFMMMPNVEQQLDNEKRFVDAAQAAGVSYVVKLSACGASATSQALLKRYHGKSEAYLEQSGLDYTHVRPNFFMQYMLLCMPSIMADNTIFLPGAGGRTGIVDVRDVAEIISLALTEDTHKGQTYDITGPEILSFTELAAEFSAVHGADIAYVDIPPGVFREALLNGGESEWTTNAVLEEFQSMANNQSAFVTDTFCKVTGRQPGTFRHFLADTLG